MWSAEQNIIKFLLFPLITGHKLLYLPAICVFFGKWWLFIQGWGIKTKTRDTCTNYPPLRILPLFLLINNCHCSSSLLNLRSDMETFLRCIIVIISVSLKCFYICGLNERNNKNLAAVPISINYFAGAIANFRSWFCGDGWRRRGSFILPQPFSLALRILFWSSSRLNK